MRFKEILEEKATYSGAKVVDLAVAFWLDVLETTPCEGSGPLKLSGLCPEYSQEMFLSTQFEHGWVRSHRRFFSRQA